MTVSRQYSENAAIWLVAEEGNNFFVTMVMKNPGHVTYINFTSEVSMSFLTTVGQTNRALVNNISVILTV